MTRVHRLSGQRPEPLGSYLAALGVFRLLAEQADHGATAHWEDDTLVVASTLDDEQLEKLFLEEYIPTPVLSPWNSSSGFGLPGKDDEVATIEATTGTRFSPYREAAGIARKLLLAQRDCPWSKEDLLRACRSEMPDAFLPWIDAAAVLTPAGAAWPPVLGTGGNVGRFDVSRNFMRHLLVVLGESRKRGYDSTAWLSRSLWGTGTAAGLKESATQFDPGAAGGANSAPEGEARAVLNPWDFVFLVEGSMLFAAGASRRLAIGARGLAAAPFSADSVSAGYASASVDEKTRGELWAPLWQRPVTLPELQRLFAEGRAQWGGRQARSGLQLAKAAGSLGVDRGVAEFARFVFAERNGQAMVALPVGRVIVRERPQVAALAELDPWLDHVRARVDGAPSTVVAALRVVDRTAFQIAAGRSGVLTRLLVDVAALEEAVGRATSFRDKNAISPVRGLTAKVWAPLLRQEHDSAELRLAICLSSLRDAAQGAGDVAASLRSLLTPVGYKAGVPRWDDASRVAGLGARSVVEVLAEAHRRRSVSVLGQRRRDRAGEPGRPGEQPGVPTRFDLGLVASLEDLDALVRGGLDFHVLGQLVSALVLLGWGAGTKGLANLPGGDVPRTCHPALALLGPFFARQPAQGSSPARVGQAGPLQSDDWPRRLDLAKLRPGVTWPALLAADRAAETLALAGARLQVAELRPLALPSPGRSLRGMGPRLGAALLCQISRRDRLAMLVQCCPDPRLDRRTAAGDSALATQVSGSSGTDGHPLDDDQADDDSADEVPHAYQEVV